MGREWLHLQAFPPNQRALKRLRCWRRLRFGERGSADLFFRACPDPAIAGEGSAAFRWFGYDSRRTAGSKIRSSWLARTPFCGVCDAPQGHVMDCPAPLSHRPTGPFGRSRTPQNGVCASPIFIKFRGPKAQATDLKNRSALPPFQLPRPTEHSCRSREMRSSSR